MDFVEIIIEKFYFKINHTLIAQLKVASKRIENSEGNVQKIKKLKIPFKFLNGLCSNNNCEVLFQNKSYRIYCKFKRDGHFGINDFFELIFSK